MPLPLTCCMLQLKKSFHPFIKGGGYGPQSIPHLSLYCLYRDVDLCSNWLRYVAADPLFAYTFTRCVWHYSNQRFNRASYCVFCGVMDHCSVFRNFTLLADHA